jgi:hypothetical protein
MSLTGGSFTTKNRSSPYGTPKGLKSPLMSPLISDPLKVAALNLEPGVTKVSAAAAAAGTGAGRGEQQQVVQPWDRNTHWQQGQWGLNRQVAGVCRDSSWGG